jgi:Rod binding domain-containing protein
VDGALPQIDVRSVTALQGERGLAAARAASGRGDGVRAAQEFERLLATLLVKELRRGLPEGFFGGGAGSDVYEGWLDEHMGASLTEGRGLGLRAALERELGPRPTESSGDADTRSTNTQASQTQVSPTQVDEVQP